MSQMNVWVDMPIMKVKSAVPIPTGAPASKLIALDSDVLSRSLRGFLSSFDEVLKEQPESIGAYSLDEIELSLAISAEGGVQLLAKMELGAKAGISIKLKRNKPD